MVRAMSMIKRSESIRVFKNRLPIGPSIATILFLSFRISIAQAEKGVFEEQHVQGGKLAAPSRGSLAGELGATQWTASDLTQGSFSLPLGLSFPEDRGPLVFPIQ